MAPQREGSRVCWRANPLPKVQIWLYWGWLLGLLAHVNICDCANISLVLRASWGAQILRGLATQRGHLFGFFVIMKSIHVIETIQSMHYYYFQLKFGS